MRGTRLSINQITLNRLSVAQAVEACQNVGIGWIGLWRDKVSDTGLQSSARLVASAGLRVSSLCRGGFFTNPDAFADNRRAVDEAAILGAEVLILVCGGLESGSRDIASARARVAEGLADLVPYAAERGVRLGIEPLHPMFCADRSVICTLGQALDLADLFPSEHVGVVVDAYHVWWDPRLRLDLARATDRIVGFHLDDWLTPLPADMLLGRGLPGEGHIDLRGLIAAVTEAGYVGPIEVEIMSERVWAATPSEVLSKLIHTVDGLVGDASVPATDNRTVDRKQ